MLATKPVLSWIRRLIGTHQIMRALEAQNGLGGRIDFSDPVQKAMNGAVVMAVVNSSSDSFFKCKFNGVELDIPRDTLRTMVHCIQARTDAPFVVEAETDHMTWLKGKLRSGNVFLDVGAATGAMTLPIAISVSGVQVVAIAPSRTANRALSETLRRNGIDNVEVRDFAVSDCAGETKFVEYKQDPAGNWPFLPEASTLAPLDECKTYPQEHYHVPVMTLDEFFNGRDDGARVRAVKIDVEGLKTKVLQGAPGGDPIYRNGRSSHCNRYSQRSVRRRNHRSWRFSLFDEGRLSV